MSNHSGLATAEDGHSRPQPGSFVWRKCFAHSMLQTLFAWCGRPSGPKKCAVNCFPIDRFSVRRDGRRDLPLGTIRRADWKPVELHEGDRRDLRRLMEHVRDVGNIAASRAGILCVSQTP